MANLQYQNPAAANAVLDSTLLGTDYATQQELRRQTVDAEDSLRSLRNLLMEIRVQNYAIMGQQMQTWGYVPIPEIPNFLAF
jgi:hypothetical protein